MKYSTIAKRIKNKGIKNNVKLISKNELPELRVAITTSERKSHNHEHHDHQKGYMKINELMGRLISMV